MFLQSVAYFCLLGLIEWFALRPSRWWSSQNSDPTVPPDAADGTPRHVTASWSKRDPNAVEYIGTGAAGYGKEVLLDVRDLSIRYDSENVKNPKPAAVEQLTFRVSRGEIFGFNGENGSGKTSTYKVLTGLLAPYAGDAFLNGNDVRGSWRRVRRVLS